MSSIHAHIDHLSPAFATPAVLKKSEILLTGGSICCLVGPSGSGKSTLLRLLSGDPRLDFAGTLVYERDGREHDLPESTTAGQVGILVPELVLPPWLTIKKILQIPSRLNKKLPLPTGERIETELTSLGLEPEVIDQRPGDLSMGMKHRVLLALYFLYSPAHVFIDELFSSLDPPTATIAITKLKERVSRDDATCLLTTHDLEFADSYGDFFYFKSGTIPTLIDVGPYGGCGTGKMRESLRRLFDQDYSQAEEKEQ